jgi:hypothetical protein
MLLRQAPLSSNPERTSRGNGNGHHAEPHPSREPLGSSDHR